MLTENNILDAVSGIRDDFIEDTARCMGYGFSWRLHAGKLIKTLLIAAILAALLTAAAAASGLFGRQQREAELPGKEPGESVYTVIPNGFAGSSTYKGSCEWRSYQPAARQEALRQGYTEPDFARGDAELYSTAQLYGALTGEMADRLYDIAERYGLRLYSGSIFFKGQQKFRDLTGVGDFISPELFDLSYGYVFSDGAFKLEGSIETAGEKHPVNLLRSRSGALYPYGSQSPRPLEGSERQYENSLGQIYYVWQGSCPVISFVSRDGESFIEIELWDVKPDGKDGDSAEKLCRETAESLDFDALCTVNGRAAEILSAPRGAEDNRDAVSKLTDFYESPVFRAAEEFQKFFNENFYGFNYTGCYGLEGYGDIDAELERLSEKYSLYYACRKTEGNEFYPEACCYDNGAWCALSVSENIDFLHCIPKDALYTGLRHFCKAEEYTRIWPFETDCGETVILYGDGPDEKGGYHIFYESENAYYICCLSTADPHGMEEAADSIDWSAFD